MPELIVLQTPPSFDCTDEHEANMRELLDSIERRGISIGWEPRGNWSDHPSRVASLCQDLHLLHIVDIMREKPVTLDAEMYTRLHGLNDNRYDYDYHYSEEELRRLATELGDQAPETTTAYCMFNNFSMYENASRLVQEFL